MVALSYRFMGFGLLVVNWADAEWECFPFVACDKITDVFTLLLTGDFAIKAGESDGKGLYGTQRIPVVQSEGIVCYSPKLHHNVVLWNVAQKRVMQCFICLANIPFCMYFSTPNCSECWLHSVYCTLRTITYNYWNSMQSIIISMKYLQIWLFSISFLYINVFTFDSYSSIEILR